MRSASQPAVIARSPEKVLAAMSSGLSLNSDHDRTSDLVAATATSFEAGSTIAIAAAGDLGSDSVGPETMAVTVVEMESY